MILRIVGGGRKDLGVGMLSVIHLLLCLYYSVYEAKFIFVHNTGFVLTRCYYFFARHRRAAAARRHTAGYKPYKASTKKEDQKLPTDNA